MKKRQVPIIIDPDQDFLDGIAEECRDLPLSETPFFVNDPAKVIDAVEENKSEISVLMISARLGRDTAVPLVRSIFKIIPGLPVVLMTDDKMADFEPDDYRLMQVMNRLAKPLSYQKMMSRLTSRDPGKPSPEKAIADGDFVAVSTGEVAPGSESDVDLYVRIRPNRYVKILRKGYAFGDRLTKYVKKGLTEFYRARGRDKSS